MDAERQNKQIQVDNDRLKNKLVQMEVNILSNIGIKNRLENIE